MALYITHVRMAGGTGHEHIARLKWRISENGSVGDNSRAEMVDYVNKGNKAYVTDGNNTVEVGVVNAQPPYLRTYADGKWTDNLLALPRF